MTFQAAQGNLYQIKAQPTYCIILIMLICYCTLREINTSLDSECWIPKQNDKRSLFLILIFSIKKPLHNDITGNQGQLVTNQGTFNFVHRSNDVNLFMYAEVIIEKLGINMLRVQKTEREWYRIS